MAAKPPRVTSTRRQPTTRAVKYPSLSQVYAPSWGRPVVPKVKPVAAAPAAPATPAAPAYSVSNLPPDASYDAAVASLQRQRDDQVAALTQARAGGLGDYGFVEGPNGTLAFDPNNPFSKAALLKKSFDTNRRSTGQSMAAGGQLYQGAFQNAQDLVNRNQVQSEDSLQKALIGFLTRNTQQKTQALTGYETAAAQAYGDRVNRFSTNPLYDPASASTDASGAVPLQPPTAAAAKASKARSPFTSMGTLRLIAQRKRK